ncbi:MAG: tRNA (adenosine(37)-N6)-threonylcarbamoyltransferase complex dimerization subunit type 1 TsaB [Chitinivibrionales bacterium]|nr:tRNA (adenosine(37)-N6)-threonylcarbamoyltransferase complex dimerization subunit type 1 TsaB [Chitinivibrionales bacterium]
MSWILGIDTSSVELGIGLIKDGENVSSFSRYVRNSHAESIAAGIGFILKNARVASQDIEKIAVAVGPGSFTGLRIGISFVKGFCLDTPTAILPVSSLESVAIGSNIRNQPVVIAFDARRNNIFWARFRVDTNACIRETADTCSPVDEFKSAITERDVVITDTLGYTKSMVFDFLKKRDPAYSVDEYPIQRGLACARKALYSSGHAESFTKIDDLSPRYLTKAYAGT